MNKRGFGGNKSGDDGKAASGRRTPKKASGLVLGRKANTGHFVNRGAACRAPTRNDSPDIAPLQETLAGLKPGLYKG
jgi:hypothetical protein